MNKTKFASELATRIGLPVSETKKIVNEFTALIMEKTAENEPVSFLGFGAFKLREQKKRQARNPKTGKPIMIEPRRIVVFKSGKELLEVLNK